MIITPLPCSKPFLIESSWCSTGVRLNLLSSTSLKSYVDLYWCFNPSDTVISTGICKDKIYLHIFADEDLDVSYDFDDLDELDQQITGAL